jgi:hypothetical protein
VLAVKHVKLKIKRVVNRKYLLKKKWNSPFQENEKKYYDYHAP